MQETDELRKQELQDAKDLASDLSVESLNHPLSSARHGGSCQHFVWHKAWTQIGRVKANR